MGCKDGRERGLRRWLDLRAAVGAGLIAGLIFCVLEMTLPPLAFGEAAWGPLRRIAAIVLGPGALEDPSTIAPAPAIIALVLHLALSVIYACIGCIAFQRVAHGPAVLLGVMLGFVLYIINFYGFVSWFPWFAESRSLWAIALHVLFGVVTAVTYHLLRRGHWKHGADYAPPTETHLRVGRFPLDVEWNAAVCAALTSGAVFMLLEMILTPLVEGASPWRPMHMIAGIALGPDAVPAPDINATFSWDIVATALLVHFTLSLIYSVIGSVVFRLVPLTLALALGLAEGLTLYAVNFYGFAQVFVWFQEARGWPPLVVHLIYGLLAAGAHKLMESPSTPTFHQLWLRLRGAEGSVRAKIPQNAVSSPRPASPYDHTALGEGRMTRLKGKKVLVTGGATGIGQATAIRFAAEGADVAINYFKQPEKAEQTEASVREACRQVRERGCSELLVQANVADEHQVRQMFQKVLETWGRLDILINNAGIQIGEPTEDSSADSFDKVVAVNLRGAYLCAREALRHFLAREGGGIILNNSSVHEDIPKPGFIGYSVSKGGMRNLTRTLALEYAGRGIRVNAVAPGAIVTPINHAWIEDDQKRAQIERGIPQRRVGTTEEIAGVFAFLASDDAAYITGQTIFVDGGLTLYPKFEEDWTTVPRASANDLLLPLLESPRDEGALPEG